jgi:hypothetical protein
MMYLSELLLVIPSILMAWWHFKLIGRGKKILHGVWAGVFCIPLAIAIYLLRHKLLGEYKEAGNFFSEIWERLIQWKAVIIYIICQLCIRLIAFNLILNKLRKEPFDYESPDPKSIIDKIEYKIFGKRIGVLYVILGVTVIVLQIILFKYN